MTEAQRPEIERGGPNAPARKGKHPYADLVESALAEPGEWFSMPVDPSLRSNAYNGIYAEYASRRVEVKVSNGRAYLRVKL
jgi:hypothetical protein